MIPIHCIAHFNTFTQVDRKILYLLQNNIFTISFPVKFCESYCTPLRIKVSVWHREGFLEVHMTVQNIRNSINLWKIFFLVELNM